MKIEKILDYNYIKFKDKLKNNCLIDINCAEFKIELNNMLVYFLNYIK